MISKCMLLGAVPCAHLVIVLPQLREELAREDAELRKRREEDLKREQDLRDLQLIAEEPKTTDKLQLSRGLLPAKPRAKTPGKPVHLAEALV